MQEIYREDPSKWPYGCNLDTIKAMGDDVFLIRKASTKEPIGFVGWQARTEMDKSASVPVKVGYYMVGILKDFRERGFAKKAVAWLIGEKAAAVDEVRAFVMPHNTASLRLADSLGVPVVKKAAANRKWIAPLVGGLANAGFWDAFTNRHDYTNTEDPFGRTAMGIMNAALGAGGGALMKSNPVAGASLMALSPTKDLAVGLLPAIPKLPGALDSLNSLANKPAPTPAPEWSGGQKASLIAALGLGGLGILGAGRSISKGLSNQGGSRLQLKVPPKHPGDQETTLDVPLDEARLSDKLQTLLYRDTRRRLREETKEQTWKRGPDKKLLTHGERVPGEEDELEKAARLIFRVTGKRADAGSLRMPVEPQKSLAFVSTVNPGSAGGDPSNPDEALAADQQAQQQQQLQQDVEAKQNEVVKTQQEMQAQQTQAQAELQKHQLEAHQLKLENANLQAQVAKTTAAPKTSTDPMVAALGKQTKQIASKVNSIMGKLAAISPTLQLALIKTARFEPVTPNAGTPNEAAYFKDLHEPGSWTGKATGWGFNDPDKTTADVYNRFAPKPSSDPTLGDTLRQTGANVAASGTKAFNFLTSPFRYAVRGANRAASRFGDVSGQVQAAGGNPLNVPWSVYREAGRGALDAATGVGAAITGVLPGVGAGIGAAGTALGLGGMMTEDQAPPAVPGLAPSPTADPSAQAIEAINSVTGGAPDVSGTVNAFGNTGALNLLQRGGAMSPRGVWAGSPFYDQATDYGNPTMNWWVRNIGNWLQPKAPQAISYQPQGFNMGGSLPMAAPGGGGSAFDSVMSAALRR